MTFLDLCEPLSSILHGNLIKLNKIDFSSYSAGTLLLVKCAEGYKVDGEETILCYQGNWTNVRKESMQGTPTCVPTSNVTLKAVANKKI